MRQVFVQGVGFWSEQMPGWSVAQKVLAGRLEMPETKSRRPGPSSLAAAERRRAPDTVCLAMQCADEAVNASGLDAARLPCVFASTHGDLPLTDYLCETVATDATAISPTRFHNSVHNAPAGYWTIAAQDREASTALAAYDSTFGAGLLEALVQCAAENRPLLFVAYDVQARGALAEVTSSTGLLSVAVVLSPVRTPTSRYALVWSLAPAPAAHQVTAVSTAAAVSLAGNALSPCLPLFESFARQETADITISAGPQLILKLNLQSEESAK